MDDAFYFNKLYPLQDKVLKTINHLDTGFYLTGGTASSRGYLHHRFSDDLDLFVNDNKLFNLWGERIINALSVTKNWHLDIILKEERFMRLLLLVEGITLKIELINDVPSHIGNITSHNILGKIDSPENILANKVTAGIDRKEAKDLADIWGFCCKMGISLTQAITDAKSKAAGIFHADLARVLCTATQDDWKVVRWIAPPPLCNEFLEDLSKLGESLLF